VPVGDAAGGIGMAQWHGISRRKPSGGRKVQARSKRATEISTEKQFALVGEAKRKIYRKTGGNTMVRVMAANKVSINNPKNGKTTLGDIHSVVENASDPNYVRRNILVKGAVIETNQGRVRITSRPGKDGVINGVLLE
jgi:small subunit ribosomal protein S8e